MPGKSTSTIPVPGGTFVHSINIKAVFQIRNHYTAMWILIYTRIRIQGPQSNKLSKKKIQTNNSKLKKDYITTTVTKISIRCFKIKLKLNLVLPFQSSRGVFTSWIGISILHDEQEVGSEPLIRSE